VKKANLFIVGAPKCGTTAWFRYLSTHPQIFFSEVKEPTFFAHDLPGMRWARTEKEYERLFARAGAATILGDASATHLFSKVAAREIAGYNPDSKILIFLRDQQDYLPSLHNHFLGRFEEGIEDFEQAWRLSGRRPPETIPKTNTEPQFLDYAAMGRFHEQVARYFASFPAEQILVTRFEEWTADPRSTYLQILSFLGLPDDGRTDFPPINEARSYPVKWIGKLITHPPRLLQLAVAALRKVTGRQALRLGERASNLLATRGYRTHVSPQLREELRVYYEADNRELERLLGNGESRTNS